MSHDPKPPENAPAPGPSDLPAWLIAVFAAVLFGALYYLNQTAGGFNPQVYAPYRSIQEVNAAQPVREVNPMMETGGHLFNLNCAACHQTTGLGLGTQFPPLAGSDWVAEKDPSRIIRIVLLGSGGTIMVKGQECNPPGPMPSMAAAIGSDENLAAVLTYVRQSWGNNAPAVTADQVKAVKAAIGSRTAACTTAELMKIPLAE
jgi:mono/diheme cytochrome c family protein